MKTTHLPLSIIHFQLSILLCAFCAFSWPNLLFAKDAPPPTIKVTNVTGKARYSTNITDKIWAPVQRGTLLSAGSVIQTAGNKSEVLLILEEKPHYGFAPSQRSNPFYTWTEITSTLTIHENSVIAIDRLDLEKTKHRTISHTRIDLRAGSITGDTRKLPPESDFQVEAGDKLTAKITPGEYLITDAGKVIVGTGTAHLEIKHSDGKVTTTQVNANLLYDPATDKTMPIPTDFKFPGILDDTNLFAPRAKAPTTPNLRPGI